MTPIKREEILKNCQVLKVQKDPDWKELPENHIKEELRAVLRHWELAARTENIGPREILDFIETLRVNIDGFKVMEQVGTPS